MPEKNLKVLYDTVSEDYGLGSYDEFHKRMQSLQNRKVFFETVSEGYDLGEFDVFEKRVLVPPLDLDAAQIVSDVTGGKVEVPAEPEPAITKPPVESLYEKIGRKYDELFGPTREEKAVEEQVEYDPEVLERYHEEMATRVSAIQPPTDIQEKLAELHGITRPQEMGTPLGRFLTETTKQAGKGVVGSAARAIRNVDKDIERESLLDDVVNWAATGEQAYLKKWDREENSFLQREIAKMTPNLGYSIVTALTAAGGGIAGTLVGTPLVGTAAALAASGGTSYRITRDQKLSQLFDMTNVASLKERGRPLSNEEWKQAVLMNDYSNLARKHAIYEAVPEAVGNVLGFKIIRGTAGRLLKKGVGKLAPEVVTAAEAVVAKIPGKGRLAVTIVGRGGAIQTSEQLQELYTNYNQQRLDAEHGLAEQPTVLGVLKDQAFQVFLLTSIMGTGAAVGGKFYDAAKERIKEKAVEVDEIRQPFEAIPAPTPEEVAVAEAAPEVKPVVPEKVIEKKPPVVEEKAPAEEKPAEEPEFINETDMETWSQRLFGKPFHELKKRERGEVFEERKKGLKIEAPPKITYTDFTAPYTPERLKAIPAKNSVIPTYGQPNQSDATMALDANGRFFTNGHVMFIDEAVAQKKRDQFWKKYGDGAEFTLSRDETDKEVVILESRFTHNIPDTEGREPLFLQAFRFSDVSNVLVLSTGKRQVTLDAGYYQEVMKEFPDAKPFMASKAETDKSGKDTKWTPVLFMVGDELKAIVMPIDPNYDYWPEVPAEYRPGEALKKEKVAKAKEEVIEKPGPEITPRHEWGEKGWEGTPGEDQELWGEMMTHVEEEETRVTPLIKDLRTEYETLKGKRDKDSRERKKEIKSQIEGLEAEYKALAEYYEYEGIGFQEKLSEEAAERAKQRGLPEDKISAFQEELSFEFSTERPYFEKNFKKTYNQIFDELLEEYLAEEKKAAGEKAEAEVEAKKPAVVVPEAAEKPEVEKPIEGVPEEKPPVAGEELDEEQRSWVEKRIAGLETKEEALKLYKGKTPVALYAQELIEKKWPEKPEGMPVEEKKPAEMTERELAEYAKQNQMETAYNIARKGFQHSQDDLELLRKQINHIAPDIEEYRSKVDKVPKLKSTIRDYDIKTEILKRATIKPKPALVEGMKSPGLFEIGEEVKFTPRDKKYLPTEGMIQEVVKNQVGDIGWNIRKDNGDVVRVWSNRGTIEVFGKAEEVPPAEKPAREPWEMTREEFDEYATKVSMEDYVYAYDEAMLNDEKFARKTGLWNKIQARDRWVKENEKAYIEGKKIPFKNRPVWSLTAEQMAKRSDDTLDETLRKHHEKTVKEALSEGKPVPVEVLAEYPDLAPKVEKKVAPPKVEKPTLTPQYDLALTVMNKLANGEKTTWQELFQAANKAYGGTQAQGKYTVKEAYDAMELGMNLQLLDNPMAMPQKDAETAKRNVKSLKKTLYNLPTQTKRTEETIELQQFSTPPPLAYAVNWVANIRKGDVVLEPSAGIGSLAVFAKNAGAKVYVNEIDEKRRAALEVEAFGFERVTKENAEYLNATLPKDIKPTVVVMNPPFSATLRARGKTQIMTGAKHIEQALDRLEEGGRLVTIVGRGMSFDHATFRSWWRDIKDKYNVKANIGISGKEYTKYGTSFANRLLVIDKTGVTDYSKVVDRDVESIEELIPLLEEVRNERTPATEQVARKPEGEGVVPAAHEVGAGPEVPVRPEPAEPVSGRGEPVRGVPRPGAVYPHYVAERPPRGGVEPSEVPPGGRRGRGPGRPEGEEGGGRGVTPVEGGRRKVAVSGPVGKALLLDAQRSSAVAPLEEKENVVFNRYTPTTTVKGAKPHPDILDESVAMSSVRLPAVDYQPQLPEKIVENGWLSDAQLEFIIYAGAAHNQILPNGQRKGIFNGDGTGVGKGRMIAGVILDNWYQGRKKAIWISKNWSLQNDARRDIEAIGWGKPPLLGQGKTKIDKSLPTGDGILFSTYSTLMREKEIQEETKSRIGQIIEWVGKDFDGVLVFDESHNMKNADDQQSEMGKQKASKTALAGLTLQNKLPNARIMYVSATGATEVRSLGYAPRLGLWGEKTQFANRQQFINNIESGGLAAMEVVARDLKSMGLYLSRSLTYEGITYDRDTVRHNLTDQQKDLYNRLANTWIKIMQGSEEWFQTLNMDGRAIGKTRSRLYGAVQRFFSSTLTSMSMPTVIKAAEADLQAKKAVLFQIVNTDEAQAKRAYLKIQKEGYTLEDLDTSPRDAILQYVQEYFPTIQWEITFDEEGNEIKKPVRDSEGNPVLNPDAVAARDEFIVMINALPVPDSPLRLLYEHFGSKRIAEFTGRSRKIYTDPRTKEVVEEKMTPATVKLDVQAFLDDKKQILVFSKAGGTGMSYHADKDFVNQRKRSHYVLQAGWRADDALQGLGRSNRSNQAQQPEYKLVNTDVPAHLRFISTIARRLDQLGALTKGQRQAGSQGLFSSSSNVEDVYGQEAVNRLFRDIAHGDVENISAEEVQNILNIRLLDRYGNLIEEHIPDVKRFLNRLLMTPLDTMKRMFEAFNDRFDQNVEQAIARGTFDAGVETVPVEDYKVLDEKIVHTDVSGATTDYNELELTQKHELVTYGDVRERYEGVCRNTRSGKVWAYGRTRQRTTDYGAVEKVKSISSVIGRRNVVEVEKFKAGYEIIPESEAKKIWGEEIEKAPKTYTENFHLITGTLLPIWNRLPSERGAVKVKRIRSKDKSVLGRIIAEDDVNSTLRALGAGEKGKRAIDSTGIIDKILSEDYQARLANGWRITRAVVSGEPRIELAGPGFYEKDLMKKMGLFIETISYRERYFIPTGEEGQSTIDRLTETHPIVNLSFRKAIDEEELSYSAVSVDLLETEGQSSDLVRRQIKKLADDFVVPIEVVQAKTDLPAHMQKAVDKQFQKGRVVQGIHSPRMKRIFLIADNLPNKQRAIEVVLHEAIGHFGLEKVFGEEMDKFYGSLIKSKKYSAEIHRMAEEEGYSLPRASKEFFAEQVESGKAEPSLWSKFLYYLRKALKAMGVDIRLGKPELMEWIKASHVAAMKEGPAAGEKKTEELKFAVAKPESPRRFEFSEPEIEERVQGAIGAREEPFFNRVADEIIDLRNKAFREYEHLPKIHKFAQLRFDLLRLAKQKGVSTDQAIREIAEITDGLKGDDYYNFAMKVVMDNFAAMLEVNEDVKLPFGLNKDNFYDEYDKLNELIKGNKLIKEAVRKRNAAWERLKKDSIRSMKAIGFNIEKRLQRKDYFRHQVLDFIRIKRLTGTGKKLKTPVGRGFLKRRKGSHLDINMDYLQAEHEVMAQMLYDIEVARTVKMIDDQYNIIEQLKARAITQNNAKILNYFEDLISQMTIPEGAEPPTAESLYRKTLNWKQAIGFSKLSKLAIEGELPSGKDNRFDHVIDSLAEGGERISSKENKEIMKYLSYLMSEYSGEAKMAAATIFKGIREKKKFIKEKLGEKYVTWEDLIPEGYVAWQPWEGNILFMADSIPAQLAEMVVNGTLEQLGLTADDIHKIKAMGGKRKVFVLKEEVALTLDNLVSEKNRNAISNADQKLIKSWKVWQLISPRRYFKYNTRNMTGDADAAFAGNPAIFKFIPQAMKELLEVYKTKGQMTGNARDWFERGGTISTLQAQEMGELNKLKIFADKFDQKVISLNLWRKYWRAARITTDFREALLRYAAYLEGLNQWKKHVRIVNYGASIPDEIDGLEDPKDKAYFLSNDLLGAYDRVGVIGQWLREHAIPFWSWKEVNARRYIRLFRNAANNNELSKAVGRKLVGSVAVSPYKLIKIGKFAIKASAFLALVQVWNNLIYRDEEEDLPEDVRNRPHITFGRDENGKVQYFSRIGALGDLLEWLNLDAAPLYVNQFMQGKMSIKEIALDMAKSPLNIIVQGARPFMKLGAELLTRRALFPDIYKPGLVRDRGLHIARSFGLANEYIAITEKPSRGYKESLPKFFLYKSDPSEAAYWDTQDEKRRFKARRGETYTGFFLTPRGDALYNLKLSLRFQDMETARQYLRLYYQLGGTDQGLDQSFRMMSPGHGLNEREQVEFKNSLDPEGRRRLAKAIRFYTDLMLTSHKVRSPRQALKIRPLKVSKIEVRKPPRKRLTLEDLARR